jgi:hypothetical protein
MSEFTEGCQRFERKWLKPRVCNKNKKEEGMAKREQKIDKVRVVKGRLIRVSNLSRPGFSNAAKEYVAVQVEDANGKNERCLLFTANQIAEAEVRARKNREDLTEKGFLSDLFD